MPFKTFLTIHLKPLTLNRKYFVLFQRMIWSILTFVKHGTALKAFQRMPSVFLHIQHPQIPISIPHYPFRFIAILIIEYPTDSSPQNDYGFRRSMVSVYRHYSPWLQRIQHPLRLVRHTIPLTEFQRQQANHPPIPFKQVSALSREMRTAPSGNGNASPRVTPGYLLAP